MKTIRVLAFFTSLLLAGLQVNAADKIGALPKLDAETAGISSYVLNNGFKIILIPYASSSNTRIELLVKSGSKVEGYGETGMAHLLEHMLFKGAGNRKNIKDDLTKIGASYNGTTTSDRTNYFETVDADPKKIDELIRLEADRFIRARFTSKDLASEMTVVRNELENSEQDPARLVMSTLARNSFRWHGYGRTTIGTRSDIEATTFSALKTFHRKHYRPDNAALIISGNFDKHRVLSLASKLFSKAKNPLLAKPANWTIEPTIAITTKSDLYLSSATTIAASSWRLPSVKDRDVHALDLAATAICDLDWGSLRKDLVIDRKLAVTASCSTSPDADYGQFMAFARAGMDANAEELSKALINHIQDAASKGVTSDQLERARLSELNSYKHAFESHEQTAELISEFEVAGDWRLLLWSRDVVNDVTLNEANSALKKWVVDTNRADVVLRHSDKEFTLDFPESFPAEEIIKKKTWPSILSKSDDPPKSLKELSAATKHIELDGGKTRAALISRKTHGDKVWLVMENDYGNDEVLLSRRTSCAAASSLIKFGGNGINRDELTSQMEKLEAIWSMNLSGISLEVPKKNLQIAFSTLYSTWSKPLLPLKEFQRYQAAQIALYEGNLKNPIKVADIEVRLRFDNFPEGHWSKPKKIESLLEETKKLTLADVEKCANDFINPSELRVGIVGNLSVDEVSSLWESKGPTKYSTVQFKRLSSPVAPTAVDTKPIKVAMPDTSNAQVSGTTVVAINKNSSEFAALQLAIEIVGGNSSSLIWKRLREESGIAYSSGMYIAPAAFDLRSTIQLYATSSIGNADKAMDQLKEVLDKVLDEGFTSDQIQQAQEVWKQKRKAYLGVEKDFASTLADSLEDGYDYAAMDKFDEKILAIDAKEATDILRKYVKPNLVVWAKGQGL